MKKTIMPILRRTHAIHAAALMMLILAIPAAYASNEHWVGTWAVSPMRHLIWWSPPQIENKTIRQIAHISIGGNVARVRFSNEFGITPLKIGSARIALSAGDESIIAGTSRKLTFGGNPSVVIPPGAPALSDPVSIQLSPLSDVAISIYLPENTPMMTYHLSGNRTTYLSSPGNYTDTVDLPIGSTETSYYFLSGVSVLASKKAAAIVALGDSITDGACSTVDANRAWPNFLAARLQAHLGFDHLSILNSGIGGNSILNLDLLGPNAQSRFDRDVSRQPGVKYAIVLEGINDIGSTPAASADDIINAQRQIIARAHELGLTIYGATLTPFEGAFYYTTEGEAKRQAVNLWIRTGGEFDGFVDFDAAVRDPANPSMFLPAYDSGDHLHPNDAGYEAMANAIDLKLFRN